MPWVLELAASKAAYFTAFDRVGAAVVSRRALAVRLPPRLTSAAPRRPRHCPTCRVVLRRKSFMVAISTLTKRNAYYSKYDTVRGQTIDTVWL